jgi:O-antigen ligase/polysaccharide polymerase Wzy-like membrane protein
LLLHVGIAFAAYAVPFISKFVLVALVPYFCFRILSSNNRDDEVLIAAAYMTGIEVFARMTGGAISYEFTKYAVIGFLVIGMFYKGINRSSWPYLFYIVLLIPGVLFSAINLNYETSMIKALASNLSGPVTLGISALYCYDRKISSIRMRQILLAVLLPIITTTVYLYLYNPSIRDVLTGTESNFEASGGYGPNQVATILGLGMFILFSRLLLFKSKLIFGIDLALLGLISYRAIVTFSRGGVVTAIIVAAIFFLTYLMYSNVRSKAQSLPKIGIIVGVVLATWLYSSISTMGLIDKRYANQDAAGRSKQDVTTGRVELLNAELEAFYSFPITGIGVGKIKEFRLAQTGRESATHNEVSRILSEHGLFGLMALAVLLFKPLIMFFNNRSNLFLFSFVAFWFVTINHSSMRLAAPAFIYGLAVLTIVSESKKNSIHRK